jgi:hypothetical protein
MFYSISSSLSQNILIKNYPVDKKDYLGDSKVTATLPAGVGRAGNRAMSKAEQKRRTDNPKVPFELEA